MEKRFSTEDGMIIVSVIVPLSQSEEKKMEQKKLQDRIDNAAKDFNIQWAIEKNNSISMAIISRMIGSEVTEDDCHQLEIDATKFMDFVDDIKVPEKKKEKTVEQINMDDVKFVENVLKDFDGEESGLSISGALLLCPAPIGHTDCGMISHSLLKDMMKVYLKYVAYYRNNE